MRILELIQSWCMTNLKVQHVSAGTCLLMINCTKRRVFSFPSDWMEYGKNADYNAVWAPLSDENAALFNETAAWDFIEDHMGIDYGWEVVLTGWLVCIVTKMVRGSKNAP